MPNDAKPNRKHFWWMILTVLLFCSIPLLIGMVPQENRVAWRLQSQGCEVRYGSVGGFWIFHPVLIFCGNDSGSTSLLTNEMLESFPKMPHIGYVRFSFTELGGLDMKPLTDIPELMMLDFNCCANLSAEEVQKLGNCPNLEILTICGTRITRDDIHTWKKCPLISLTLVSAQMTDDELEEIANFPSLSHLELCGNPGITDKGLEHIRKLKHLERLYLETTSVTEEGIEDFQKRHPNAKLEIYSDF